MIVRIRGRDGIELDKAFEAIETSSPYLCVHLSNMEDPLFLTVAEAWTITHVSSGAAVVSRLPSKQLALIVADWLSPKHDWSLPMQQVQRDAPRDLRLAIAAIRNLAAAYVLGVAEILEIVESPLVIDPECPIHGRRQQT